MTRSNRRCAAVAARKPHARGFHARARKTGARAECVSVRFAGRCGGKTSIPPRYSIALHELA
eukprot:2005750-Lingulodinium_polyedra.AAC.1